MKIDLMELDYLYEYLENNDKEKLEELEITDEIDFRMYILDLILNNIEYDFGIDFHDYVDINRFVFYD